MDNDCIEEMRKASIDIGTNTVLLLVGTTTGHLVKPVREEQRVPRLGKGVSANGLLSNEGINRVIQVLKEYHDILISDYPDIDPRSVIVTATSAVRDAGNRAEFIDRLKNETGFEVRVLKGTEEAEWTYAGALSVLEVAFRDEPVAVLDIGGGSTEVAVGQGYTLEDRFSFQMGSVRFTEKYLPGDPPDGMAISTCESAVEKMFMSRQLSIPAKSKLVGVAGTVTSLAYMEIKPGKYDPALLNGYKLDLYVVDKWLDSLSTMTIDEMITRWPEIMKGRADIFIGGLLILKGFLNSYNIRELTVSTGGIRYGALLNL